MFALINYGSLYHDELYQALCVARYKESPLGLLTYWTGNLWTSYFGFSLLNLRILASVEMLCAMGVSSAMLFRMTHNLKLTSFVFLLGCILLRTGTFYFYNWDTGSYLLSALALCTLVSFLEHETNWKLILLGFFIGLMTLARATSGIYLPLGMAIVGFNGFSVRKRKLTALHLTYIFAAWLSTVLLFTTIILGSPLEYLRLFRQGNVVSGHSPINDIHVLWGNLAKVVINLPNTWLAGIGTVFISLIIARLKNKPVAILFILIWLGFCFLLYYHSSLHSATPFIDLGMGAPIGIGLVLSAPVAALFHNNLKLDKTTVLMIWACACMLICVTFGSDMFTKRTVTGFTVPVITGVLWRLKNYKELHRYVKTLLTTCFITFGSLYAMHFIIMTSNKEVFEECTIEPFAGIRYRTEFYEAFKKSYPALLEANKEGLNYVYLGNHYVNDILFGEGPALSLHDYHYELSQPEIWFSRKPIFIDKINAVVYPTGDYTPDFNQIIDDLKEEGFTEKREVGQAVILTRK